MEGNRFDDLTRVMGGSLNRRVLLKRAVAATSGGVLAMIGLDRAAADETCAGFKEWCTADDECCTGYCSSKKRRCICPPGTHYCSQSGICCPEGVACNDRVCQDLCPPDIDCEDGDLCTINTCNPAIGCVSTPIECPVCQICSRGACIVDESMQGAACTDGNVAGICVDGQCVADTCDDECPACTVCSQGECVPDANQDGSICQLYPTDHQGICAAGVCVPNCPGGCPECQACEIQGACVSDSTQNGSVCTTPVGGGTCADGVCVTDACTDDECPPCQRCTNMGCIADQSQNGSSCPSEYQNYQCINGACVCPVDLFVCPSPAYPDPTICVCVCPPDITCPGGGSPNPNNGCLCP